MNLSTGIAENGAGHTFDPNAFDEVCLELNAGDALIFTPTLNHMSHPNLSESARVLGPVYGLIQIHNGIPPECHVTLDQKKFRKDAIWAHLIGNVRKPDSTC